MSTPTLRNGMVWMIAGCRAASATALRAETEPTPVARLVPAAASSGTPVGDVGSHARSARFLPGSGLVAVQAGVGAERVAGDAAGPRPEAAGPRVRIVGWQVNGAAGTSLQRMQAQCGALCAFLAHRTGSRGAADVASLKQLVTRVAGGYRVSPTLRVSLSPRVQRVRGQPMTGFSVRIKGV